MRKLLLWSCVVDAYSKLYPSMITIKRMNMSSSSPNGPLCGNVSPTFSRWVKPINRRACERNLFSSLQWWTNSRKRLLNRCKAWVRTTTPPLLTSFPPMFWSTMLVGVSGCAWKEYLPIKWSMSMSMVWPCPFRLDNFSWPSVVAMRKTRPRSTAHRRSARCWSISRKRKSSTIESSSNVRSLKCVSVKAYSSLFSSSFTWWFWHWSSASLMLSFSSIRRTTRFPASQWIFQTNLRASSTVSSKFTNLDLPSLRWCCHVWSPIGTFRFHFSVLPLRCLMILISTSDDFNENLI